MPTTDRNFNPSGNEDVDAIKEAVLTLELALDKHCNEGRRKNTALIHLEIAAMFAVKSVFEP